jgi:hypothetical protein
MGGDMPSNLISGAKAYITPNTGDTLKNIMSGAATGYDTAMAYKKNILEQEREKQKMDIEKAKTLGELQKYGTVIPESQIPLKKSIAMGKARTLPGIVSEKREGYLPVELTEGGTRYIPQGQAGLAESMMTTEKNIPSGAMKLDVLGGYYVPQGQQPINEPKPETDPGQGRQWVPDQTFKEINGKLVRVNSWKSEPIKTGVNVITPGQELNAGITLRKEFTANPLVKSYLEIASQTDKMNYALERMGQTRDRNAIDQSIIMTFNRILDPTSVVRESEYARTADGISMLSWAEGKLKRVAAGGAGLTDKDRIEMVKMANIFADSSKAVYDRIEKDYIDIITSNKLDPSKILPKTYGRQSFRAKVLQEPRNERFYGTEVK